MNFVIVFFCSIAFASLCACSSQVDQSVLPTPTPSASPANGTGTEEASQPSAQASPAPQRCSMVSEVIAVKGKKIQMPATGKMVVEAHLVAIEDRLFWPSNGSDRIQPHLTRSCTILMTKFNVKNCANVYDAGFKKVWTPSEGGHIGQGSSSLPPQINEMFSGNMMWTSSSKPRPGTKFLAQANGKAVVFVMGYETGPGDTARWLGGLQPEVHYFLGTSNASQIKIGRLKDQSLPIGPISCP